jgi:preprotein translocase subunit SecG
VINSFTLVLLINSTFLIGLILNQNESTKDSSSNQTSRSSLNPLEKFTWIGLSIQLILLLVQTKITDN